MTNSMTLVHTRSQFVVGRKILSGSPIILLPVALILLALFRQFAHASFIDSSALKPSIILIAPQSFKVPIQSSSLNGNHGGDEDALDAAAKLQQQQFVALINDIKDEHDDQALRQQYRKLTLQVRDAESPITGQLFFEHTFDYFQPNTSHLLVPVNLDQVSPNGIRNIRSGADAGFSSDSASSPVSIAQKLIVSVRPYQLDSGFGSGSIEFVSSAPVPVESVPSYDGRRSFAVIQTDKPSYKPEDKVRIRAMVVNENFRPTIKEELKLQIKNPQHLTVEEVRFPRTSNDLALTTSQDSQLKRPNLYLDHVFEFPPEPMQGVWSAQLLHDDPITNDTISFEVKEYVLPPFEIEFNLPKYILPTSTHVDGSISVKYHYGKPVRGKAQFKFGVRQSAASKIKYIARTSIKDIEPITGKVEFKMKTEKFKEYDWFPSIAGSKLVVEVTVNELTSGHVETAQDTSCLFLSHAYRISFEDSIDDFKPDLNQQLTIRIVESQTGVPLRAGERVLAQYRDQNRTILNSSPLLNGDKPVDFRQGLEVESTTDSDGRATFNIGPIRNETTTIEVTFKALNTTILKDILPSPTEIVPGDHINLKAAELAVGNHRLVRHESENGYISLMNKSVSLLNVGDQFVSDLLIHDAAISPQKIFYMIVSRGRILSLDTLNTDGLVSFRIQDSMMPAIRVVLFALTQDSVGYLSDSMRINIGEDLNCGLKLRYKSNSVQDPRWPPNSFRPNDRGRLAIEARQNDLVSLIGVDAAVYTMNNRTRLESSRIINRIKRLDPGCGFGGGRNNLDVFHNAGLLLFKDASSVRTSGSAQIGSSCESLASQLRIIEDMQIGYARTQFTEWAQKQRHSKAELPGVSNRPSAYRLAMSSRHRHKREVDVEAILKRYKDPLHKACCRLGTWEDVPQRRNCSVRAKIVDKYMRQDEFSACANVYLDCCRSVFGDALSLSSVLSDRNFGIDEDVITSRTVQHLQAPQAYDPSVTAPDLDQLDRIEEQTMIRKDFRETWLFDIVEISSADGRADLDVQLPHTITSWTVSAMALNRQQPVCLMPRPMKISTFQDVFIQVSMPHKVVQGEQVDLVTSIFNYSPRVQEVYVYLFGVEDVCSEAEPGERSDRKRVRIDKHSSQALIFPMIPLKVGKYPVKIFAVTLNSNRSSDIVERELNVVPKGKPVIDETTFSLDPMNHQRRNKRAIQTGNLVDEIDSSKALQRSRVRLTPTRDSEFIVPQTRECIVSAIGDKMGQSLQTALLDVENLIRLPHGCGEQVMIYLGPTLYTARYLNSISKLTGDLRWRATRYIQSGYKRVLNFRRDDGAFSAFPRREPSIWLTAFVTKMLCQAETTDFLKDQVRIDRTVINSALRWLVDQQDQDNGHWTELNPVYHREMLGGVLKESVLSSFVVVTLNECAHHSPDVVDEKELESVPFDPSDHHPNVQTNGVDKLKLASQRAEKALKRDRSKAVQARNPYALALTAYALSGSHPNDAAAAMNDLMMLSDRSTARNHLSWRGDYPIETAAYALQALIELAPILEPSTGSSGAQKGSSWSPGTDSIAISNWLSTRRSYTGAFESTQDTIVALEALSKLAQVQATASSSASSWFQSPNKSPVLTCNVTINNRTKRSIKFGSDNAQVLQSFKLDSFDIDPSSGESLDIITQGNGLGTMSVRVKYNVFHNEDELCRFNIDSSIEEWRPKPIGGAPKQISVPSADGDSSRPVNESDIDDGFFQNFNREMLADLNLVNQYEGPKDDEGAAPPPPQVDPSNKPRPVVLRMRRMAPSSSDSSEDSWTSKVLTSVKLKLPSWLGGNPPLNVTSQSPKQTTTTATTTARPRNRQDRFVDTSNYQSDMPTNQNKRNSTYRRSAQSLVPMVLQHAGIPSDAKLNTLSTQIDFNSNDTKVQSSTQQRLASQMAKKLILLLRVCVHHMANKDSEMAVIEIGILSGFKPNEADLEEIIKDAGTPAMKYEVSTDRSLVVIYMRGIPSSGQYCFQFRLIRESFVHNLQSGFIRAYEYYTPTHTCASFYTPTRVAELIETRCDSSGQVCQCASRNMCPATKKLLDLSQIQAHNATSARNQMVDLICSNKFDLVSLVKLKSVRHFETGRLFKLSVKVKSDLRGNLTKIIEAQRQQSHGKIQSVRKPQQLPATDVSIDNQDEESSLDTLSLTIDSSCVKNDQLLLHLAHPSQWKQGGELMILFGRSDSLEKRYFMTTPQKSHLPITNSAPAVHSFPKPKPAVINGLQHIAATPAPGESLLSDDAQQSQYSTNLPLDKDSILHDVTYQSKMGAREAINNLILWVELRARREKWTCPL